MRVADNMNYAQVTQNLNRNRKEASDLNNQAATMKRVTKPSDDPAGTTRVLSARSDLASYQQYDKNLNYAKSFLEFSEQSLSELSDMLIRIKELAIAQANEAGANESTRRSTAAEIEQAYAQTIQIANRKIGDRYLFGGYKTTQPPFDRGGKYRGDDGELMIEIDKGAFLPMNIPGSKIFLGKGFAVRTLVGVDEGVPKTAEAIENLQREQEAIKNGERPEKPKSADGAELRGPASVSNKAEDQKDGENIFGVIRSLHTSLVASDTEGIQSTLERIDETINQVVMARAQFGSRVMTLNNTVDSISRQALDSKVLASSVEDVNAFELFSDINKNETTLKATLETSGRLITPSLLDFLK